MGVVVAAALAGSLAGCGDAPDAPLGGLRWSNALSDDMGLSMSADLDVVQVPGDLRSSSDLGDGGDLAGGIPPAEFGVAPVDLASPGADFGAAPDLRFTPSDFAVPPMIDFAAPRDLSAPASDLAAPRDFTMQPPPLDLSPRPDLVAPDLSMPDLSIPDMSMPDLSAADLAARDLISSDAADLAMACPPNPGCLDRHPSRITTANPMGFCRPMCDPVCVSQYWRYVFWVTQYNVSGTFGWGEHQGIGIIGHEYGYDDRFPWNTLGARMPPWRHPMTGQLWAQGMQVPAATQFTMRTTNPSGESAGNVPVSQSGQPATQSAYCFHSLHLDRPIYNHGRSLARAVPTDNYYRSRDLIPMRQLDVVDQCRRWDGAWCRSATAQHPNDIRACMTGITDGACDSKCGNCSYVAITAGDQGGAVAYWEDVWVRRALLTVHGARNEVVPRVEYVGGVSAGAVDRPWVDFYSWSRLQRRWYISSTRRVDAPFTHCFDTTAGYVPGVNNPQEWVVAGSLAFQRDGVTGRWGHNSNTDAAMERRLFLACGNDPRTAVTEAGLHGMCDTCGTPVMRAGQTTQYPCTARTCTAQLSWAPTGGIHNVDDWGVGLWPGFAGNPNDGANPSWRGAARPIPACRWGGFAVWGM